MAMYTIEEIEKILNDKGLETTNRGAISKNNPELRPERNITNVGGVCTGPRDEWYFFRIKNQAIYNNIINSNDLNIDNPFDFPIDEFVNDDGKYLKYDNMSPSQQEKFNQVYGKLSQLKKYRNHIADLDENRSARKVICVKHGAVERSKLSKDESIVICFTETDLKIIIDIIAEYFNLDK